MCSSSLLLLAFAAAAAAAVSTEANVNPWSQHAQDLIAATRSSRTRQGVFDPEFDCSWRAVAITYAAQIQPWMSTAQLQAVVDSLELATLGVSQTRK